MQLLSLCALTHSSVKANMTDKEPTITVKHLTSAEISRELSLVGKTEQKSKATWTVCPDG